MPERSRTRIEGLVARAVAHPVRTLVALLVLGGLLRFALAFGTEGNAFDLESFRLVRDQLRNSPLHVYSLDYTNVWQRWPYPPGFFGFILLVDAVARGTGLAFDDVLRALLSLFDLALAWLCWGVLRRRAGEGRALAGAALVALGPSFMVISGHHGQIDAVAWLPAVAALALWDDPRHAGRRALYAGVLIGLGIAIKTVPGLMLLALLPTVRSRREAVQLTVIAGAIPLLALVPFAIGDARGVAALSDYHGVPGLGGISLLVQPDLTRQWLQLQDLGDGLTLNRLNAILLNRGGAVTGLCVLGAFALLAWRRTPAPTAAVVLLLTVWVFGFNFLIAYAVWGLAILIVIGRLREAAALQAAMLVPTLLVYGGRGLDTPVPTWMVYGLYVPIMTGLLVVFVLVLLRLLVDVSGLRFPPDRLPRPLAWVLSRPISSG